MAEQQIVCATGIVVSTAISAGGVDAQHSEGVIVSTAISAGRIALNHAEGFVDPANN